MAQQPGGECRRFARFEASERVLLDAVFAQKVREEHPER